MKKEFSGCLSAFSPAVKDNVPYVKLSVKTTETGADKHLLYGTEDIDNAFASLKNFVANKGYGNTKCGLDNPLRVKLTFASFTFDAYLVSIAVKKKVDKEVGDMAEYTFNFEKDPNDADTKFWASHLKVKDDDEKDDQDDGEDEVSPVDDEIMKQTDSLLGEDAPKKKKKNKPGFVMYAVSIETISEETSDEDADIASEQEEA